jgi:hypothetical protein
MIFELDLIDIPYNKNSLDGPSGHWFALGFGQTSDNSNFDDLVMCELNFKKERGVQEAGRCYDKVWNKDLKYELDQT